VAFLSTSGWAHLPCSWLAARTVRRATLLASLALAAAAVACVGRTPGAKLGAAGNSIGLRRADGCEELQFRASTGASSPATPLAELVVVVNGEVCHREGVPGNATIYGELAAVCPDPGLFEPGSNLVEVILVSPECGRPALARRLAECVGPDVD
jgi:hypothetical protein